MIMLSAVVYTEYNNCLMYLSPTSIGIQDNCLLLCIIPMLLVANVECRLYTYFLLLRERLKVINKLINLYKKEIKNARNFKDFMVKDKLFFITEFMQPQKLKASLNKTNVAKNNDHAIKKIFKFLKCLFDFRLGDNNFGVHCHDIKSINFVEHIMIIKSIHTKLYEISEIINVAYGLQIISIISVQFITLTTLLYYFFMKLVR